MKDEKKGADNIEDLSLSGWPIEFDDESIKSLVETEPQLTIDEIAEKLNSTHGTIYLHAISKMLKLGKWVPRELFKENRQYRMNVCTSLLSRQYQCPFLDCIVTRDEKWILYNTTTRKTVGGQK